ncbi:acyltransferase family protein [Actinomadura sp. SCN-SB]|uniref:acyltransferase family protein n=1 Tax=Actinomadura sp. SCN-SB TaxID=3373092 RepID=UPI003752C34C
MTFPRQGTAPAAPDIRTAPSGDTAGRRSGYQRDPYFDNAKFAAALLVVVGHVWAEFDDASAVVDAAYKTVYAFHMPVFVFITGYFSRGFTRSPEKFRTLLPTLVVPYLIFIVPYRAQIVLLRGEPSEVAELFMPHYLMWFLVALVCWRLSAPLWAHLRHPVAVAVVVSLGAGLWIWAEDGTLSRMAGLLPFFVLGLVIDPERVRRLRRPATRPLGVAVLVAAPIAFYAWQHGPFDLPSIDMRLLWWDSGYEEMGYSALEGMAGRATALLTAAVLGAAFLAAMPRGRTWYTELGTRTMYVYLLHGLVVKTFDYTGVLALPAVRTPLGIVAVTLAAVALGVLLSTRPVKTATRWAVEPRARWLLMTGPRSGSGTRPLTGASQ